MRFLFPSQDWTGRPLGLSEILLPGSSEINPLNDAMDAYAIAMLLVIAFISLSVAALGGYLYWRAHHPLPEPESLDRFFEEHGGSPALDDGLPSESTKRESPAVPESWERPADWWRNPDGDL